MSMDPDMLVGDAGQEGGLSIPFLGETMLLTLGLRANPIELPSKTSTHFDPKVSQSV